MAQPSMFGLTLTPEQQIQKENEARLMQISSMSPQQQRNYLALKAGEGLGQGIFGKTEDPRLQQATMQRQIYDQALQEAGGDATSSTFYKALAKLASRIPGMESFAQQAAQQASELASKELSPQAKKYAELIRQGVPEDEARAAAYGSAGSKIAAAKEAKAEQARQSIATAQVALEAIDSAKKLAGYSTVGAGSLLAGLPMTSARDLKANIDTIKANLGFQQLAEMRKASPTGGALGQVTEKELNFLQSTIASLDQGMSVPAFKAALAKIERHYSNWLSAMQKAGLVGDKTAETPASPAAAQTAPAATSGWSIVK